MRVGVPWRDAPDCYGSWRAVYALFRRWQRAGAWAQIVPALQTRADAAGLIAWDVSVDSTMARAHQHPAARRRPGAAAGAARWASRHGQKVLSLVVTAGQRGDSPQFRTGLDGINVPNNTR